MIADAPSTANLCDAALALGVLNRFITDVPPLISGSSAAGPVRCVRHHGSVDIFLEAIDLADPGEILVIDNDDRSDEGCIGDLITLEAKAAGLAGIIVWGRNRDSREIRAIGLPVFSRGACPTGPQRLDPRSNDSFGVAALGPETIRDGDWLVADDDGIFVASPGDWPRLHLAALEIRGREAEQARKIEQGDSLRRQLDFDHFISARDRDPALTFRDHLRQVGGEVEK